MLGHSDEEEDFHPTTQEDIAVLNMAITNADTLVQSASSCLQWVIGHCLYIRVAFAELGSSVAEA